MEKEENLDIQDLNFIGELKHVLDEVGIDREDICIIGSAPLGLYGIKENGDLEFIATEEVREKIRDYAKENSECEFRDLGGVRFNEKIHTSRKDRYGLVGFDDERLINDSETHLVVDGFKINRLEVQLAFKGAERRHKDLKHIEMIEESGVMDSDEWNWDLVNLVPPWDRPSRSQSMIERISDSLDRNGVKLTGRKAAEKIENRIKSKYESFKRRNFGANIPPEVVDDVETCYPLPNLVSRQYSSYEEFNRYDLVAKLLELEGEKEFKLDKDADGNRLAVNKEREIASGVSHLAEKIDSWKDYLPRDAPDKNLPVEIRRNSESNGMTREDAVEQFGKDNISLIEERRKELLVETGTAFYAILWPGIDGYFSDVEDILRSELKVIDSESYRLEEGFENFIRDVYEADDRSDYWFREVKIHHLKKFEPKIKILKIELPNPEFFRMADTHKMSNKIYDLKIDIREKCEELVDDYTYATDIHMTDNFKHNAHLGNILTRIDGDKYNRE